MPAFDRSQFLQQAAKHALRYCLDDLVMTSTQPESKNYSKYRYISDVFSTVRCIWSRLFLSAPSRLAKLIRSPTDSVNSDAIDTILPFSGYAPLNTKRRVSIETGSGIAYLGQSMDAIVIDRAT